MKQWLAVSMLVVLVLVPLGGVEAAPSIDEEPDILLDAVDCPAGQCPATDPDNPLVYSGSTAVSWPAGGMYRSTQIECTGAGCSSVDIYVTIHARMQASMAASGFQTYLRMDAQGNNGANHETFVACGTTASVDCWGYVSYVIPAAEITGDTADPWHVIWRLWTVGGVGMDSATYTYTVTISTSPVNTDTCDDNWQMMELVASGSIDATDEDGEGAALEDGEFYRLYVGGGPWNDGTDDRYDTAVSFDDGSNWIETEDLASGEAGLPPECVQNDPDDENAIVVVFEAEGETFDIRVDDTAGNFANNSGDMDYSLYRVRYLDDITCADQFSYNALSPIATGTIQANTAAGSTPLTSTQWTSLGVQVGDWIVIATSSGSWQNNGSGDLRYDIAMQNPDTTWTELSASSWTECSDTTGNYIRAFVQIPSLTFRLRVNDTDGTWTNTGSISYSLYTATYDPFPSACEMTFEIGEFVETRTVQAVAETGALVMRDLYCDVPQFGVDGSLSGFIENPLQAPGYTCIDGMLYQPLTPEQVAAMSAETAFRWLMIETSGGPWYDGQTADYEGALDSGDGFSNLADYPDAACVVETDPLGHLRMYWPHTAAVDYYLFRMNDDAGDFYNNSGSLTYSVYQYINQQVIDPEDPLEADTCSDFDYDEETGVPIVIPASSSSGVLLPLIDPGSLYALVSSGGPWSNDGASSYDLAISDDGGATWEDFTTYGAMLCGELSVDADHAAVWIRAAEGARYRMRVLDAGNDYTDNTGSMTVTVYEAETGVNPWGSCADDYQLSEVTLTDVEKTIPANLSGGISVNNISRNTDGSYGYFSIEITGGPWTTGTTESYLAQISDDGGATWQDLEDADFAECVVTTNGQIGSDALIRIYFAGTNGNYRLRVDDETTFLDNTGTLEYRLYRSRIVNPNNIDDLPDDSSVPAEWVVTCYETCRMPSSLFTYVDAFGALGAVDTGNETLNTILRGSVVAVQAVASSLRGLLMDEIELDESGQGLVMKIPIPDIGSWIEYFRCALLQWLSWCPEHTAAVGGITGRFDGLEPFGTFLEIKDAAETAQVTMASYIIGGGENGEDDFRPPSVIASTGTGGEDAELDAWGGVVPILPDTSIWNGGGLDLTIGGGETAEEQSYREYCTAGFQPFVGDAVLGLCFFLGLMHSLPGGILISAGIILDIGAIWMLIVVVERDWIKTGAAA